MPNATVLIIDDEKNILLTLSQALQLEGYKTETANGGQAGLDAVARGVVDVVLLDVKMPDMDGLAVLETLSATRPELPVIMMSGHGTIETALKATRHGARDFLEKPIARERLLLAVRNALAHRAVMEELSTLREEAGRFEMVGQSPAMQRVYELIRRSAPSEGRVLITGENGSGKELIARAIHQNSRRKSGAFVKLNCAAVPHELIESELFGHEKGAFTGAIGARRGKFELAHEGTLFLDEVGDMPAAMQAKLLRVLQEGELERVGGGETIKVDVRVIAATNKNLQMEIEKGRFREDLFFRLNVVQIHSPALRERKEDLPALVNSFLEDACKRNGKRSMKLAPEALTRLGAWDFPGNVRELRNVIERLAILCEGPIITGPEADALLPRREGTVPVAAVAASSMTMNALPPSPAPTAVRFKADVPFRDQVEEAEREIILGALAHTRDNATEAARMLDLERGHFYKKMKSLGLRRSGGETSSQPGVEANKVPASPPAE
jgi:two-component system, NtrC family, nitrogen regulation response regulator NtrX